MLQGYNKTMADFNLPEPDERGNGWDRYLPQRVNDLNQQEHQARADNLEVGLNREQRVNFI
jgi:hypothetical protein